MNGGIVGVIIGGSGGKWDIRLKESGLLVKGFEPPNSKFKLGIGDPVSLKDTSISWQYKRFNILEKVT